MLLNKNGVKIIESDVKNNNLIVFLLGAPGIGKSSIIEDICAKNGWQCFVMQCNQLSMTADLTGCRTIEYKDASGEKQAKQVFFPHATIKEAIEYATSHPGETVVILLDEINRTAAAVTSALLTFITGRRIGTEKLPANIKLIAAGNDDGNVISLDMASMSRFIVRRCKPDAATFLGLGERHPLIEELLTQHPELIYQEKNAVIDPDNGDIFSEDESEFQQITTPRTIEGLNAAMLSNPSLIGGMSEETLKEYVSGFTGDTLFTETLCTMIMANKFKLSAPSKIEAPVRPACIDALDTATTLTEMQTIAAGLTDEEKSAAILYMVYDSKTDYANRMRAVVSVYGKNMLLNDDQKKLTTIINNGEYNRDAYSEITAADSVLSNSFKMIYGE